LTNVKEGRIDRERVFRDNRLLLLLLVLLQEENFRMV